MENLDLKEGKYRSVQKDPQYFGGYLNMARLNIYIISNHIAIQLNQNINESIANQKKIALIDNEEKIKSSFLCNEHQKLNWNLVYAKTKRFLSLIKIFDYESLPKSEKTDSINSGKDFRKMCATLKLVFNEIQEFRNDYSHYYSINNGDKRKILVNDEIILFLKDNFSRAIAYTKERYEGILVDEDFELVTEKINSLVNDEKEIQTIGLVFLTSMFLEREYAFQFISKITGLKGTQNNSFIATREVLMAFCLKLPHQKLISEDPLQSLALNISNELNRCPKALFHVMTETEKEEFRPQITSEKYNNILSNSLNETNEDYEEYIQSITKRVRHTNRFSYYALSFIDNTNLFKKFFFHVNLGKVCLDEYEKSFNGIEEPRRVVDNIKAFGNLLNLKRVNEITDNENIIIKTTPVINSRIANFPFEFEQFAPNYNTTKNKIAIKSREDVGKIIPNREHNKVKRRIKQPVADAFLSLNEMPKIILLEMLQSGEAEKLITNFIQINNSKLFDLTFIEEIKSKTPNHWTVFQKRSQKENQNNAYNDKNRKELLNRKTELNKIVKHHNISVSLVPTRILNYWLNINDVNTAQIISDRIKQIKKDCKDGLKKIKKDKYPKIGVMASFLAKDIVDMTISKEKKEKITSFYYDKMQHCLALYLDTEKKKEFIKLISGLELNELGGHPFLNHINFSQLKYTQDIYEDYLELKLQWILKTLYVFNKKTRKTEVKLSTDKSTIPYSLSKLIEINEKKTRSDYLTTWLNNITRQNQNKANKKPIDLPTNLFDETLCNLLKKQLTEHHIPFIESDNYNKLFKIWWKEVRKDDVQTLYNAEREYHIYEERICFKMNTKKKLAEYYKNTFDEVAKKKLIERKLEQKTNRRLPDLDVKQIEQTFKKAIGETEKKIRFLQEEDRLMLLMVSSLITPTQPMSIKLKNAKDLLNRTINIEQKVTGNLSFNADGEILARNKPVISKVIVAQRKTKNYSVLNQYIYDRRLPELFEFFNTDKITLEDLKIELDAYNTSKQTVLDLVFKLEKAIVSKDLEGLKKYVETETSHIQHKPFLKWLLAKDYIDIKKYRFMLMVRNAFAHNQYPHKICMELQISQWNVNKWASQITKMYNILQSEVMIEIEK
jgi:hypothetical protein